MDGLISPKYQMKLIKDVNNAVSREYDDVLDIRRYIEKWHKDNYEPGSYGDYWQNFVIYEKEKGKIDLPATLHSMPGKLLLQIAVDLGVDTPGFIPAVAEFQNDIKSDYKTAYDSFQKAYNHIESDPALAVGLVNSALENIIKEILKDNRLAEKANPKDTTTKLAGTILKEFKLLNTEFPKEIKTIGNNLLSISQAIESLRSEQTNFHGKTADENILNEPLFAQLAVNAVTTVALFLNAYYQLKFPKPVAAIQESSDELPF